MATSRFNAFAFKALSNSSIYGYSSTHIMTTRQFARTPKSTTKSTIKAKTTKTTSKPKKSTKKAAKPSKTKTEIRNDAKNAKLIKQYPDPSLPKRPLSSYFRFGAEYRNKNKIQVSPNTIGDAAKRIANAWRGLPDQTKAVYTEQYANELKQYKIAKEKYDGSDRPQLWLEKILKLAKEKPVKSGYMLFMKQSLPKMKARNPVTPQPQILSMTAAEWSSISAQDKNKWSAKAKAAYGEWEKKLK